ncbi:hypothetical protein [Caminibacter sp.]
MDIAANQVIRDLKITQLLALSEDMYAPFPKDSSQKEIDRSKYWFKQRWQFKFATDKENGIKHIIYYVFSDKPAKRSANFDRQVIKGSLKHELAKDFEGNYIYGGDTYIYKRSEMRNVKYDLTQKYGIKRVEMLSSYGRKKDGYIKILFDNFGKVFLYEGKRGDGKDYNPIDRKLLTSDAKIRLCKDTECMECIQINLTPLGYLYKSGCK